MLWKRDLLSIKFILSKHVWLFFRSLFKIISTACLSFFSSSHSLPLFLFLLPFWVLYRAAIDPGDDEIFPCCLKKAGQPTRPNTGRSAPY